MYVVYVMCLLVALNGASPLGSMAPYGIHGIIAGTLVTILSLSGQTTNLVSNLLLYSATYSVEVTIRVLGLSQLHSNGGSYITVCIIGI